MVFHEDIVWLLSITNGKLYAGKQQEWAWKARQGEAWWLLEHVEGVCSQSGIPPPLYALGAIRSWDYVRA